MAGQQHSNTLDGIEARRPEVECPEPVEGRFRVYILRCGDGSFYVGHCRDVSRRLTQHEHGSGSRHTRLHPPVRLVWTESQPNEVAAVQRELQIKRWSRAKKEALIRGDTAALKALAARRT